MSGGITFRDLPGEFSPPERAAAHIAELKTVAEREAYWLRIPEGWRPMIGYFAVLAIAARIADMPSKFERQNALAAVPEMWRAEVKGRVVSYFETAHLRRSVRAA